MTASNEKEERGIATEGVGEEREGGGCIGGFGQRRKSSSRQHCNTGGRDEELRTLVRHAKERDTGGGEGG